MNEQIPRVYELSTVPSDIADLQNNLGKPSIRGAALLQSVMTEEHARALRNDVAVLPGNTTANDRWDVSYRLDEGDQRDIKHLRTIRGLSGSLTKLFATDLAQMNTAFRRLGQWSPTEFTAMHARKTTSEPVVRKWHESLPVRNYESIPSRFWGVVAVAIADGTADFHTAGQNNASWAVTPGDIVIMRGANLFDANDTSTTHPTFAIDNIGDNGLTAVVYRANAKPNEYDANFTYANHSVPEPDEDDEDDQFGIWGY